LEAIEKAGMSGVLRQAGPYTLFAPNDEAFARMNTERILNDPVNLKDTLAYHLVAGKYTFNDLKEMETLGTENGKSLTIALDEGEMVVDNGKFVKNDIECSNGIIHVIDNVFQPHLSGWYREE
jgi:uncharacterized surface protein with fasciclin (FAS1) repeats